MPERSFSSPSYRYGFQGQEKDDEVKGEGNSVNYKYRMHDPRLGRFFAVDPLTSSYPHYSPYSFSGNKVISAIELEGLEELSIHQKDAAGNKTTTYTGTPGELGDDYSKQVVNQLSQEIVKHNNNLDGLTTLDVTIVGNPTVRTEKTAYDVRKVYSLNMEYSWTYMGDNGVLHSGSGTFVTDFESIGVGSLLEVALAVVLPAAGKVIVRNVRPIASTSLAFLKTQSSSIGKFIRSRSAPVIIDQVAKYKELLTPKNQFDFSKTLYRGLTGSEKTSSMIFLTDDAAVAATYVKNGGQVMSYQVTNHSIQALELSGELTTKTGIHGVGGKISKEFVFHGKDLVEALQSIAK